MEGLALKIGKLKEIINSIDSVRQEEIGDHQLLDILQQINLIFSQIRKCRFCDNFISDTLEFINIINNVAELSVSVKSEVVSRCIVSVLELITRGDVSFGFKVEVLKLTNVLLENCPNKTKENLLAQAVFEKLLVKFGKQLDTVGDYEYQVGLIECLFRIIPKKFRPKYGKLLFSDALLLLEQFLGIRDQDFETDCRTFLNDYNNDASLKQRVRSIPCISAFLGDRELRKPNDPGYDEFWVDFNYGSNRLTIFCEDYNAGSQDFSEDGSWETLSVWKSDVQRYKITAEEDSHYLDVELVNPIPTLYPSQTGVSGKIVTFTFDNTWRMEEAAVQTFGGDKRFLQPLKPKVSLPTNSVCVRARDSPDFEMDSNYDELDEEIGTFQNPLIDQTCPPKLSMPAPTRVKVSVPCVPVVLDSSQNSMLEPVQAIAMKYVQSFQPEGMGSNTSEPEEGLCADEDLEGVSVGDENSSPVISKVSEPVSHVNLGFGKSMKTVHQKSAGIPTPKTPTIRGPSKVKVKTPVAVLTPNEGTKSKKTFKKKLSTVKSSEHQEKHALKAAAEKENKSTSFPDSCPGNIDNKKLHAEQRTKRNCQSRANVVQKKQTCDAKRQGKVKNYINSSVNSISISNTVGNAEPTENSTENDSKKSKVEKLKNINKGPVQDNQQNSKIPETVEKKKSAEFEATKEDFAYNSQDSLINEDTCKEIYSMEQNGLSFTEENFQCSVEGSDSKTPKESAANVDKTKREKTENSKITKEKEQISTKKRSKSKRGKDLKLNKNAPDLEIQNDDEVEVIESSCDPEQLESEQKSKSAECVASTGNSDEPINNELSCRMNKSVADKEKRSKGKSKDRTTNKTMTDKSNSDVLKGDTEDVIQNMNVSATFGKGSRKKKSSNLNKGQEVNKMIEQTKTGLTHSDIDNSNEDSVEVAPTTCIAMDSDKDKSIQQNEQAKKKINHKESQAKKSDSKKADLDVYDFNDVDEMRRSFVAENRTNSCKTDKFVECVNDVQSDIENDIPAQCTNDGVIVLEKKSRKTGTKKDRKSNKSENEELNTKVNCDKEIVSNQTINRPIPQTGNKKSRFNKGRKAQEPDSTSSEQSSRKTRSSRQRKQTATKTCVEESDTESSVDKEIEVIQSSFDPENDEEVVNSRKPLRNEDEGVFKAPSVVQPAKRKPNRNKQILVSTPLDNLESEVENFDGENEEILSSIGCSDSDGNMEHLDRYNVTEDKNHSTKRTKRGVDHAERKNTFDTDRQSNELPVLAQKGKCSSKSSKGKGVKPKQKASLKDVLEDEELGHSQLREDSCGKPKRKASLKDVMEDEEEGYLQPREDSLSLSKFKNQSHENTGMTTKKKVNECDRDVHSECEDDIQSANISLVLEKDFKKTDAKKDRKSMKSKIVDLDTEDKKNDSKKTNKNPIQNTEKRKRRLNKGRNTAPETTADITSLKPRARKTRYNRQREKTATGMNAKESDTESQDDNDVEVIQSSFYPEIDEGVLNSRKSTRKEDEGVFKAPSIVQPAKRKKKTNKQILVSTPFKDFDVESLDGGRNEDINEEILSSIDCDMEHNNIVDKEHSTKNNKEHGKDHTGEQNNLKDGRQNLQYTVGDEEVGSSQSDENSLSLFNTNLSQGNAIKSLSQKKFFKDRSGSSTYERHDMKSACMSAAGVQREKSCEVEYGNSKNRVYLAMSYSSTDRINMPSEREDSLGDPYDFDKECERSSTKSEKNSKRRQEAKSKAKQGICGTQTQPKDFGTSLKKKNSACKDSMDQSFKKKLVSVSELVDDNISITSKQGYVKDKKKNLSKHSGKIVGDVNDSEEDSVYSKSQAWCLPKPSSTKTPKCLKEHRKKEMTDKNVNRLMARLLGRKRNASTCQDSNEEEEYDHHDALCLSKGDSTSPVKIPHCEITLDEVVGVPRLQGGNNQLPCFKHHEHQGNQRKKARLESPKTTGTALERKQETTIKNHNARSVTTKAMPKPKTKDARRYSDQGPSTTTKSSFTEEIENIDSEISDDQLCRSDDVILEEDLPPENNIITRFNLFCKKIVGEPGEDVLIEKTRKETSRTLDNADRRKEKQACKNSNDYGLNSSNIPRTPKFVMYDPEDQEEICSIKMPMTLPCSDIEGSQDGSLQSEDLQIQPLQESSKAECNRSRGNRLLQQTNNTDLSGFVSGYTTEIKPSRSSLKRKYESMLQCDDEDDVHRNNLNAGYDLTDTLEMCPLRPRRLFSSDFKEITGSSDDEDREDLYGRSEHNSSSQASSHNTISNEMLGSSMSHLEGIGIDAGVSTIVKAFGMDFKKQIQTKQQCLDILTKTTLKSSQRHLRNMFTERTERRANIMEKFGKKLLAELSALGKDVRTLEDNEAKTLDFFQQQMKTIINCRISQEKRLENLKRMQVDFIASMCHMDQYESNQQKTFKNAVKKDLTTMQRKLLTDAQRQELTTVRRSLHTMIR